MFVAYDIPFVPLLIIFGIIILFASVPAMKDMNYLGKRLIMFVGFPLSVVLAIIFFHTGTGLKGVSDRGEYDNPNNIPLFSHSKSIDTSAISHTISDETDYTNVIISIDSTDVETIMNLKKGQVNQFTAIDKDGSTVKGNFYFSQTSLKITARTDDNVQQFVIMSENTDKDTQK